ncbi:MAG: hypothetical protein JST62_11260 [Bacteroidetes bacterium]|nr:hypothetical protein [Bacteroidota bacterium]
MKIINTSKGILLLSLINFLGLQAQNRDFNINFSSEGDVKAMGIIKIDLTQNKSKLMGTANYATNNGQLDTGVLSVDGYVKNKIAYISFYDQKGRALANGTLYYTDDNTVKFNQKTNSDQLPKIAYLYAPIFNQQPTKPAPVVKNFNNNFTVKCTNKEDVAAKGKFDLEIVQKGIKIEGVSRYSKFSDGSNSGLMSVNGYVKKGIAYIRFRDQKGNTLADGELQYDGKNIVFRQTSFSEFVPHSATLQK